MTRILIIEDEPALAELIALYCKHAGWQTLMCSSAEEALGALKAAEFSLITLDINLPGMDGLEFLTHAAPTLRCPVLIISARESDDDIVDGLTLGADEYVTKPFAPKVLIARMQAMLRRNFEPTPITRTECYQIGRYTLEPENYRFRDGDNRVRLSTREMDILILLAKAEGKPISAYDILDQVWGQQSAEASAVGVYIQRLRKKLDTNNEASVIETVHGRGYAIQVERVR